MKNIELLDCTLRDGAYVTDGNFGAAVIKGIIKKTQDAKINIIECGWLKDQPHVAGKSFFHVPGDIEQYITEKNPNSTYVAMIDWDRYDLSQLPPNDGKTIDAIRVVFPQQKFRDGIALGKIIKDKGYRVYFQAANTLGYSEDELIALADEINAAKPEALSVVDTFGAMYEEDLDKIIDILNQRLDSGIKLGFHSHNNQQLSFALSAHFVNRLAESGRGIIVDASLNGMGRGAGNTPTELMVSYLNRKYHGSYDTDLLLSAIDMYITPFAESLKWGYSIPYFIAGMYCCHVNNIAYLLENYRTNSADMRNIFESLTPEERRKYDYDLLEQRYIENLNKLIDDSAATAELQSELKDKKILLIMPGTSAVKEKAAIDLFISENRPLVIGVNALIDGYDYNYLFFTNSVRYDFAASFYPEKFNCFKKIITSNIKTTAEADERIINFNAVIKRGWQHFDNAGIMALRLLDKLHVKEVAIAGFDGFTSNRDLNYADTSLPPIDPHKPWNELNEEIKSMLDDFCMMTENRMTLSFITKSKFYKSEEQ